MKITSLIITLLFLYIGPLNAQSASNERRLALVIGNKDYVEASVLKNPVNDANAVSSALIQLGFVVTTVTNADYKKLSASINQFTKDLRPTDVVVLYYSGHGIGYNGKNYIIPIDAQIDCLEEIDANGIPTDKFMLAFEAKRVKNSFIFLDACRNLPTSKVCNATEKGFGVPIGLSRPSTNPSGSMIAFATREGKTASDNPNEDYSLFTNELLKHLTVPNLGLRQILDLTKQGVEQRSKGSQSPSRYDELSADFYFVLNEKSEPAPIFQPITPEVVKPLVTGTKKYLDLPFAEMAYIPGGTFEMGDTRDEGIAIEKPVHKVTLDGFYMGKYEVTQEQWESVMGGNPRGIKGCATCPVYKVSWKTVQDFLKKLNERTGLNYRLPTEAEWEYAAGGGASNRTRFGNGTDKLDSKEVNFLANSRIYLKSYSNLGEYRGDVISVGSFRPNQLGLYDMTGNVWEWCSDWYYEWPRTNYYKVSATTNPTGLSDGSHRIKRGGGFSSTPLDCRVTFRGYEYPTIASEPTGFRVVLPQ